METKDPAAVTGHECTPLVETDDASALPAHASHMAAEQGSADKDPSSGITLDRQDDFAFMRASKRMDTAMEHLFLVPGLLPGANGTASTAEDDSYVVAAGYPVEPDYEEILRACDPELLKKYKSDSLKYSKYIHDTSCKLFSFYHLMENGSSNCT
jgi:hypothetical protein